MSFASFDHLHSWRWWRFLAFLVFVNHSFGLTTDGILLLSFKYSVLSDPLGVLSSWTYNDQTPCSWNGVACGAPDGVSDQIYRVISLSLPNSQLLASIPSDLGLIQHLQTFDLSNNSVNGSIPLSIYNATELRFLDLSNNLISGEVPELVGGLRNLEFLNLSDNALAGKLPENLTSLPNLSVLSLKNNYFYGSIPSGFNSVKVLDLSSNLINGSLPTDFGSGNLNYLNVSYNRLSGDIPMEFGNKFPTNATLDLSFNNLTGEIPESSVFFNQDKQSFSGNPELCGKPLRNLCPIPSTMSTAPNDTSPTSPPAIAAIPKTIDSSPSSNSTSSATGSQQSRFKSTTIVAIVLGDVAGIAILVVVFIYILKRRRKNGNPKKEEAEKEFDWASSSTTDENRGLRSWACMIKQRKTDEEDSTDSSTGSESEAEGVGEGQNSQFNLKPAAATAIAAAEEKKGELVTVDGEKELELETLLKASAYILGATGSSIIYKAVLEDGTTLAVRRIGESGLERFRDFETQIRVIAKLVHPNLVRIRGFYWGSDEKLVIYDFVPNGSLANARYRKVGSSPCPLPWELRLKIARGTARGLTYIHEKKQVHGNLKPSNILLGADMEPKIGDFGLERLVMGDNSYKAGGSARNFGSKRSTASRDSFQDLSALSNPSPSPSSMGCISPYYAPESLRNLKPSPKWDVYSFGVILLELLTGKVIVSDEFGPASSTWSAMLTEEEKSKVLRMVDMAIRADMEDKEDALLSLLKLGYGCISPVPQKRPHMREVLQGLDKFASSSSSSSSSYYFGHL